MVKNMDTHDFDSVVLEDPGQDMTREIKFSQCGNGIKNKIVGGEEAKAHSFPWSVSLRVSWGTYFCGGAIVSEKVS